MGRVLESSAVARTLRVDVITGRFAASILAVMVVALTQSTPAFAHRGRSRLDSASSTRRWEVDRRGYGVHAHVGAPRIRRLHDLADHRLWAWRSLTSLPNAVDPTNVQEPALWRRVQTGLVGTTGGRVASLWTGSRWRRTPPLV